MDNNKKIDWIGVAMDKAGAFFAFGNAQFEEKKKESIKYVSCGSGLICPKETVKQLMIDIKEGSKNAVLQDLATNGKEAIIKRELYNNEAFYDGDIERTFEALTAYNISLEEIREVYQSERETAYKLIEG